MLPSDVDCSPVHQTFLQRSKIKKKVDTRSPNDLGMFLCERLDMHVSMDM